MDDDDADYMQGSDDEVCLLNVLRRYTIQPDDNS